jgi:hypothetical protein
VHDATAEQSAPTPHARAMRGKRTSRFMALAM